MMRIRYLICTFVLVLLSITAVCASDIDNQTTPLTDNNKDNYQVFIQESVQINDSSENDNTYNSQEPGSFNELQQLIDSKNIVNLTKDYTAKDGEGKVWVKGDNKVINGNGHTLNGNGKTSMFGINGGNITLNNICFKNGFDTDGGAIYISSIKNFIILNKCTFDSNKAQDNGGAIYCSEPNNPMILKDCSFKNNKVQEGSGGAICNNNNYLCVVRGFFNGNIANVGGAISSLGAVVEESIFKSNVARKASGGGAIRSTFLYVDNSSFIANEADDGFGGAINTNSLIFGQDCIFRNNRADYCGGAIYTERIGSDIKSSVFENNFLRLRSTNNRGGGGAIYVVASSASDFGVYNSSFISNKANGDGGAIYTNCHLDLVNTTFKNNNAHIDTWLVRSFGGAVYSTSSVFIHNCSFIHNTVENHGGAIKADSIAFSNKGVTSFIENNAKIGGAIYTNTISGKAIKKVEIVKHDAPVLTKLKNEFGWWTMTYGGAGLLSRDVLFEEDEKFGGAHYYKDTIVFDNGKSVSNLIFINNSALDGSGGAAYVCDECYITIENCYFKSNHCTDEGGAIFFDDHSTELTLIHNIFVNNVAKEGQSIANDGEYVTIENNWWGLNNLDGSNDGGQLREYRFWGSSFHHDSKKTSVTFSSEGKYIYEPVVLKINFDWNLPDSRYYFDDLTVTSQNKGSFVYKLVNGSSICIYYIPEELGVHRINVKFHSQEHEYCINVSEDSREMVKNTTTTASLSGANINGSFDVGYTCGAVRSIGVNETFINLTGGYAYSDLGNNYYRMINYFTGENLIFYNVTVNDSASLFNCFKLVHKEIYSYCDFININLLNKTYELNSCTWYDSDYEYLLYVPYGKVLINGNGATIKDGGNKLIFAYISKHATLTLNNVTVTNFRQCLKNYGNVVCSNTVFSRNKAPNSGYASAVIVNHNQAYFINSVFDNNYHPDAFYTSVTYKHVDTMGNHGDLCNRAGVLFAKSDSYNVFVNSTFKSLNDNVFGKKSSTIIFYQDTFGENWRHVRHAEGMFQGYNVFDVGCGVTVKPLSLWYNKNADFNKSIFNCSNVSELCDALALVDGYNNYSCFVINLNSNTTYSISQELLIKNTVSSTLRIAPMRDNGGLDYTTYLCDVSHIPVIINGNGATIQLSNNKMDNPNHFALVSKSSTLVISNCTFKGFNGVILNEGHTILNNCTFDSNKWHETRSENNKKFDSDKCGAVYNNNQMECYNCTFINNAGGYAGAIYCDGSSVLTVIGGVFRNNNVLTGPLHIEKEEDIRSVENAAIRLERVDVKVNNQENSFIMKPSLKVADVINLTVRDMADLIQARSIVNNNKGSYNLIKINFVNNGKKFYWFYPDEYLFNVAYGCVNIYGDGSFITVPSYASSSSSYKFLKVNRGAVAILSDLVVNGFNCAILNDGTLNIVNCVLDANRVDYDFERDYGGAIYNTGVLNITSSVFSNNYAKYGGAIYNVGECNCFNSTFKDNIAYVSGGYLIDINNFDKGRVNFFAMNESAVHVSYDYKMSSEMRDTLWTIGLVGTFAVSYITSLVTSGIFITYGLAAYLNVGAGIGLGTAVGYGLGAIMAAVECSIDRDYSNFWNNFIRYWMSATIGASLGAATANLVFAPPKPEQIHNNINKAEDRAKAKIKAENNKRFNDGFKKIRIKADNLRKEMDTNPQKLEEVKNFYDQ